MIHGGKITDPLHRPMHLFETDLNRLADQEVVNRKLR